MSYSVRRLHFLILWQIAIRQFFDICIGLTSTLTWLNSLHKCKQHFGFPSEFLTPLEYYQHCNYGLNIHMKVSSETGCRDNIDSNFTCVWISLFTHLMRLRSHINCGMPIICIFNHCYGFLLFIQHMTNYKFINWDLTYILCSINNTHSDYLSCATKCLIKPSLQIRD